MNSFDRFFVGDYVLCGFADNFPHPVWGNEKFLGQIFFKGEMPRSHYSGVCIKILKLGYCTYTNLSEAHLYENELDLYILRPLTKAQFQILEAMDFLVSNIK